MASKPTILVIGTLDTKQSEIAYLRSAILSIGSCQTQMLDVGRLGQAADQKDIPQEEILSPLTEIAASLANAPRGEYVDKAIEHCTPVVEELVKSGKVQGVVSAGGSTGSSLATALMRHACPIGFPKVMVSTMASGDIKPYIEETDITMMYSVVDIAGVNSMLKQILSNAAGAIAGMTSANVAWKKETSTAVGKRIAITMFGVTTPCVDQIRKILTTTPHDVSEYEIYVFHATGAGGRAMERLIEEGQIDAVVDLTTTEVADELFGGVLTAGPDRLEVAAKKGIPMIVSVGACDMVNFGPKDSVPEKYKDRNLFVHNPTVTLMRTTKEENQQIGNFIVKKLSTHSTDHSKIRVLLPKGGVSMIDKPEQPFHDAEADEELFKTIGDGLKPTKIEVFQYPENINDEVFAIQVCEHLLEVMGIDPRKYRLANARRRRWSFDHGRTIAAVRRASLVEVPDAN
ncbi:hypothetical protein H2198_010985 [Neophaeococcomyces mojaviensis]|uniref:Uncharacterized protein n=1 Tax=Neophaeococcomyces mojaviensis TaxID=3383035 RepID=A0ACC2ZM30_9EURO|nr:hypothetical protein H2198_010985 [Knufia sp. JES_112]